MVCFTRSLVASLARVRPIYLIVEVVTVAQHQESEIAAELPVYLPAEEHHGVGLARSLRMPEDAEPAAYAAALLYSPDRAIYG